MYARTATKKARLGIIRFQRHKRIVPSGKSRSTYLYYADNEPTSTLDASAQQRLAGFMRTHLAEGGLILAASQFSLRYENGIYPWPNGLQSTRYSFSFMCWEADARMIAEPM
jgi:hypothetical protein